MTTIHAYTNDQVLTDVLHEDLRRARAAAQNMIPTKTGAAAAVGLVLPELNGRLDGYAIRVPTINVSLVDLTFIAARDTSVDEVNAVMKAASESGPLKGLLGYSTLPLVSSDFNHDARSSIFEALLTKVSGRLVKVSSWYDNEWGFSNRMLDTTVALMNLGVNAGLVMSDASRFGARMLCGGAAAIVHAVLPFLFMTTASRISDSLVAMRAASRGRTVKIVDAATMLPLDYEI